MPPNGASIFAKIGEFSPVQGRSATRDRIGGRTTQAFASIDDGFSIIVIECQRVERNGSICALFSPYTGFGDQRAVKAGPSGCRYIVDERGDRSFGLQRCDDRAPST